MRRIFLLAGLVFGLLGCDPAGGEGDGSGGATGPGGAGGQGGSDAPGGSGGSGGSGGEDAQLLDPEWEPCNLFTEGPGFPAPTVPATCAAVEAPLRWEKPAGGKLTLFAKRMAAALPRTGSIWLLDGGPGFGGIGLEGLAAILASQRPDLDVYIPHHRGTGQSSRLGCPDAEHPDSPGGTAIVAEEWPACFTALEQQWGSGLAAFTTTEAARDLAAWIASTRGDGAVYLFGSSYGTLLANRYLQLEPEGLAGVVLDSICPGRGCYIAEQDVRYDEVGRAFLDRCGADPWCSERAGPDPLGTYRAALAAFEEGSHCTALHAAGLDRSLLRVALGALLNHVQARVAIPAITHRFSRCSDADVEALLHLVGALFEDEGPQHPAYATYSQVLGNHISLSEMWPDPAPPLETLRAEAESTLIATGTSLEALSLWETWPRYEPDAWADRWASTRVPMLLLNGTLDPATPLSLAETAREAFSASHQHFVALEGAPHNTLLQSPMTVPGKHCGMELFLGFLADPEALLDRSCTGLLVPFAFEPQPGIAEALFGTPDLYE